MTRNHRHAVRFARPIAALSIGLLGCEIVLRILIPPTIYYSAWFTAGVHQRDEQLGFVFRPDYRGAMRHADHVWMEPLRLDENGFRLAAIRQRDPQSIESRRIVMLGGASMAFCYGLPDADCLHQQVADRFPQDCRIDLLSWPGFNLSQDFEKLSRFSEASQFDTAILFAYGEQDYVHDPDWERLPAAEFRMIDSVVYPEDRAARLGGDWYDRSYVVAGGCRTWLVGETILGRLGLWQSAAAPPASSIAEKGEPTIYAAASKLRRLGIDSVIVVALPWQETRVGPERMPAPAAPGITVVDLRDEPTSVRFDWIASGHYGQQSARHLAGKVAAALARK